MAVEFEHHVPFNAITINKIRIGGKAPKSIWKGSKEVMKVTKGSTVVYQKVNTTYGIKLVVQKINDSTTISDKTYFQQTSKSGNDVYTSLYIPYNAYNYTLQATLYEGATIKFNATTNLAISKIDTPASVNLTTSAPFFYIKYSYQPGGSSTVGRGTYTITNAYSSDCKPRIYLRTFNLGSGIAAVCKINYNFCNYYSGTSIMSTGFIQKYGDGSLVTSSTGGGLIGTTTWADQRLISWSRGTSPYSATLNAITHLHVLTTNGTESGIFTGSWQIRISTSKPTYANRKTAGTQIFKGTGIIEYNTNQACLVTSITTTGNDTRYMWFCEQ